MDKSDKIDRLSGQSSGFRPNSVSQQWEAELGRAAIYQPVDDLARRIPRVLKAQSIGFEPEKRHTIRERFDKIGVSFVISGAGDYHQNARKWRVKGPCVLFQWPGFDYHYGPDDEWEEFYVTYPEAIASELSSELWASLRHKPLVVLSDADKLRKRCKEIFALVPRLEFAGTIDLVDHLLERLVLETLEASLRSDDQSLEARLQDVRIWLEGNYTSSVDLDELASRHGFSPRSFRRYWHQRFDITPLNFLTSLRMRRACDLLTCGTLPVAEIARLVGLDDVYYFSRRFRQTMGESPSSFRKGHGIAGEREKVQPTM